MNLRIRGEGVKNPEFLRTSLMEAPEGSERGPLTPLSLLHRQTRRFLKKATFKIRPKFTKKLSLFVTHLKNPVKWQESPSHRKQGDHVKMNNLLLGRLREARASLKFLSSSYKLSCP